MRILSGDDTGLVKIYDVERSQMTMKFGEQQQGNCINQIVYFNDSSEDIVLTGSKNTTLSMYEIDYENKKENLMTCIQLEEEANANTEIMGIHKLKNTNKFVYTYANNQTYAIEYNLEAGDFSEDIVEIYKPENQKDVQKTLLNSNQRNLLTLSKGINPQMIDLETKKQIWKARNVKNDWLDLQVPVWDVDARFFNDDKSAYVATAHSKIRIYDFLIKNTQPVTDLLIDDKKLQEKSPFTAMELSHCKNYVYVANKLGSVFKLDTRKNFGMVGKLRGGAGSVKDMQIHPTLPYIATVSLDRYIRIFNENEKIVGKQYMGQRLNTLLFSKEQVVDQDDFEEEAVEKHNITTYKIEAKQTTEDNRENKKKFQGLKKHTIKLDYLKKKMEKQSGFVNESENKKQEKQNYQENEEDYSQEEEEENDDEDDDEDDIDEEINDDSMDGEDDEEDDADELDSEDEDLDDSSEEIDNTIQDKLQQRKGQTKQQYKQQNKKPLTQQNKSKNNNGNNKKKQQMTKKISKKK